MQIWLWRWSYCIYSELLGICWNLEDVTPRPKSNSFKSASETSPQEIKVTFGERFERLQVQEMMKKSDYITERQKQKGYRTDMSSLNESLSCWASNLIWAWWNVQHSVDSLLSCTLSLLTLWDLLLWSNTLIVIVRVP